jgi:hypothetical protein
MSALKPKQVRMNLNEECQAMFAALASATQDLPESQLSTLIFTAGLRALRERDYEFRIPLRFAVVEEKEVPVVPSVRRR